MRIGRSTDCQPEDRFDLDEWSEGRAAGCLFGSSMLDGAEIYQAVGFVEREMPRIGVGKAAAGAGRMWLDCAGTEQDSHSFVAERLDAPAEWVTASQCRVDEREAPRSG